MSNRRPEEVFLCQDKTQRNNKSHKNFYTRRLILRLKYYEIIDLVGPTNNVIAQETRKLTNDRPPSDTSESSNSFFLSN